MRDGKFGECPSQIDAFGSRCRQIYTHSTAFLDADEKELRIKSVKAKDEHQPLVNGSASRQHQKDEKPQIEVES